MERVFKALQVPGSRSKIECAAPTQRVVDVDSGDPQRDLSVAVKETTTYNVAAKAGLLDRWLDKVVHASGSEFVYFTTLIGLLAWAFMGIPYGQSNIWKIVISDTQAILNMVFDAFLMRQQLNAYDTRLIVAARLKSRSFSHTRMLSQLITTGRHEKIQPRRFQELVQKDFHT